MLFLNFEYIPYLHVSLSNRMLVWTPIRMDTDSAKLFAGIILLGLFGHIAARWRASRMDRRPNGCRRDNGPEWHTNGSNTHLCRHLVLDIVHRSHAHWGLSGTYSGTWINFWISFFKSFFSHSKQGVLYPALHNLISKWAPPAERGKFISSLLGGTFGTVITWPLSGILIENLGWVWAFYVPAVITIILTIVWYMIVYDTPSQHPRISAEERDYIEKSLGDNISKKKVSMRAPPPVPFSLRVRGE